MEQIHNSATFDKEYINKWENKKKSNRTWENATNYFENLVAGIETYQSNSRGTANQARYESAANIRG